MARQMVRKTWVRVLLITLGVVLLLVAGYASCVRAVGCYVGTGVPFPFEEGLVPEPVYTEVWHGPSWTKDSRHIVFATSVDQESPYSPMQIYTVAADGSSLTRISSNFVEFGPTISPDGSQVLYTYRDDALRPDTDSHGGIGVSSIDGSGSRRFTEGVERVDLDYAQQWSPGGRYISFSRFGRNKCSFLFLRTKASGVFTMKADGSDVKKVGHIRSVNTKSGLDGEPGEVLSFTGVGEWTPDGRLTLMGIEKANGEEPSLQKALYTADADGSNLAKLFVVPSEDWGSVISAFRWSPDGEHLAFVARVKDSIYLYTVRPDGSGLRQMADPQLMGVGDAGYVSWSPDGSHILFSVYQREYQYTEKGHRGRLYVVGVDGTELRELAEVFHGTWSPDGSMIASVDFKPDGSHAALFIMALDGSDKRVLVKRGPNGLLRAVQAQ